MNNRQIANNLTASQIFKLIKVMAGSPQRLSPEVQATIKRGTYRGTFSIHGAAAQRIAKRDGKAYARDVLGQWESLHASISARHESEGLHVYVARKFGSVKAAIGVIQAARAACPSPSVSIPEQQQQQQEAGPVGCPQEPRQGNCTSRNGYAPQRKFESPEEVANALYEGVGYLSVAIYQTRLMLDWAYEEVGKAIWWHQEIKEEASKANAPASEHALEMLTMRLETVSKIIRDTASLIPEGPRMVAPQG